MAISEKDSTIRSRLFGLLLIGLLLLGYATQQIITIWTPKSSLVPVKGTLFSSDVYVKTVTSKGRYGSETESNKSQLIFYLNEHKMKFVLSENIGSNYNNESYQNISSKLKIADSITVWVKKSELDYWEPHVYQIETNRAMVLDFDTVRYKNRPFTAFLLFMGIGCVFYPLYIFFPKFFNRKREEVENLKE